jgi:hypothetical protein
MNNSVFKEFKEDISRITDNLSLKDAITSDRKGSHKIRDNIVFYKQAWTESLTYFAIIQTVIIFTALVPNSIENINSVLTIFHIPIQFPVDASSIFSVLLLFIILIFGVISYRFFGLVRRSGEIGTLFSPGLILLYEQNKEIMKRLDKLERIDDNK